MGQKFKLFIDFVKFRIQHHRILVITNIVSLLKIPKNLEKNKKKTENYFENQYAVQ